MPTKTEFDWEDPEAREGLRSAMLESIWLSPFCVDYALPRLPSNHALGQAFDVEWSEAYGDFTMASSSPLNRIHADIAVDDILIGRECQGCLDRIKENDRVLWFDFLAYGEIKGTVAIHAGCLAASVHIEEQDRPDKAITDLERLAR